MILRRFIRLIQKDYTTYKGPLPKALNIKGVDKQLEGCYVTMITDGLIDVVCPISNPKILGDKDAIDIDFADRTRLGRLKHRVAKLDNGNIAGIYVTEIP